MTSSRLRVGVIGLGVGEQHAIAFARDERCELAALCDLSEGTLGRVGARYPGTRRTTDPDELLRDASLDAVAIASYDDAHFAQVLTALRHGKHVFVEKPLCRDEDELRDLRAASRAAPGLVLASNLVLRAAPLYRWVRTERESGRLGRVYAFDGDYLYGRMHKITDGWRREVEDYSVLLGGGVHLVDLMLFATGERPVRVSAVGNRIATAGTAFRYLDFATATFEFESGLVGRVTANFGCMHSHQHVVRVFATEATVLHDDCGPRVHGSRDPEVPARPLELDPLPPSKGALVPAFVDAVVGERDSGVGAEHEFAVIAACLAADRALAAGEAVAVDYA
jgi:predicted dehydrogenase